MTATKTQYDCHSVLELEALSKGDKGVLLEAVRGELCSLGIAGFGWHSRHFRNAGHCQHTHTE